MFIGVIGLLVFAAVVSLVLGLARRAPSVMEARMRDFKTRAVVQVEGETDLSVPFTERVLAPGLEGSARTKTHPCSSGAARGGRKATRGGVRASSRAREDGVRERAPSSKIRSIPA